MKTALQAKLSQQLSLTPQLLQSIRLLQLSALELEQEVADALESNVMLEAEEDSGESEAISETAVKASEEVAVDPADDYEIESSWDAVTADVSNRGPALEDDEGFGANAAAPDATTARERVLEQLDLVLASMKERQIAEYLIDEIDDNGYLTEDLEKIRAEMTPDLNASAADVELILWRIQRLDPVGFGARNLAECLSVQLEMLPAATAGRDLALRVVNEQLELLGSHDTAALAKALGAAKSDIAMAERLILSLDPKPGATLPDDNALYIVPEVAVSRRGSGWRVELLGSRGSRVRVNEVYEQMLHESRDARGAAAMKDQLQEARWLVRGLEMRRDTLMRATTVIFERQNAFLEQGDEGMVPLTLKEVADAIGMHESTVSRITTNKFVQTPRGVFELKHFFSSHLSGQSGAGVAGTAVRAMVRRLIESENPERPLCDGTIAALLARKGVRVARRTVAKYRESMKIATAKERRRAVTARRELAAVG